MMVIDMLLDSNYIQPMLDSLFLKLKPLQDTKSKGGDLFDFIGGAKNT